MADINKEQPEVYKVLGTAGMLCCRQQRGGNKISSHSWGTAIDLTIDGKLDVRGDKKVQNGLTLIAPIFNRHGWYWGAAFRTEDAMHFEAGKALVKQWATPGNVPATVVAASAPAQAGLPVGRPAPYVPLRLNDAGVRVKQVQEKLNRLGFAIRPDGEFGPKTDSAVRAFQLRHHLKPDGIVGRATANALGL